nr:protease Do-like 8, chloroplastic [Ipomoea batatas]
MCIWIYTAYALGDPSVTVEQVTPPTFPSGALSPSEEKIVQLFEKNTYSVVNIFDVTLRPRLNVGGAVEIPEGNGSGVVWDGEGHIVTNYHVIGNSLSRNPTRGEVVARVNILASDGLQKNFEGKLVGADRSKDLAVLKVVRAGLNIDFAPDAIANQLNVRNGALVLLVPGNSLAAKAGILPTTRGFAGNIVLGDIIEAVDNKPVRNKADLYKVLDDYNVGDKVQLKIRRGNENVELSVVLEEKE